MKIFEVSEESTVLQTENCDNINIFMQYFIHPNQNRHKEIRTCLIKNVLNKLISKIYLLNERIYKKEELGIDSNKIVQVNIKNRLKYADVFRYINDNSIEGYNIFMNSDIFLDETINNLQKTNIHLNKKMYALLRYECINLDKYKESKLFGPRADSQDTWIIHSNFNVTNEECKIFNFEFGKPGCDNKLIYLMKTLGYNVLNEPDFIRTYHLHNTQIRNYTQKDIISEPYGFIIPLKYLKTQMIYNEHFFIEDYNIYKGNEKLFHYLSTKIDKNENFVIPRVAGVEMNYAGFIPLLELSDKNRQNQILQYLKNNIVTMKKNAGINLTSMNSIKKYSEMYLDCFNNCEMFSNWVPYDNVYKYISNSQNFIDNVYSSRQKIYAFTYDIFQFIKNTPWTHSLKGKRILFITPFQESINDKIETRKHIYGIDLFPECEIITIKPPQTQGDERSEDFLIELKTFTDKLDNIKDKYDIALVSCGGYGNLVCNYIYKSGKSAIYIGGVLQMYWGILGQRWLRERNDIVRLFLNEYWTRPKESEKPQNYKNIESSCYW